MSDELISRSYVENIVKEEFVDLQDGTEEWRTYVNDTCENITNKVHNAQPVKAYTLLQVAELVELNQKLIDQLEERRPQGEWINHRNDYGHNIADCSLCGKTMQWHDEDEDGIPRYCWYCGASMRRNDDNPPMEYFKNGGI